MTTRVRPHIIPLGCAALLLLLACRAGESASPSPEATTSATPASAPPPATTPDCCKAPYGRWAIVVVYAQKNGTCDKVAGPPRVGARRAEVVTWRIYNRCAKNVTVQLNDFVHYAKDPGILSAKDEGYGKEPSRDGTERLDPFDGDHEKTVKAGSVDDLSLKVKAGATYGVYAYTTRLSGHADKDQQIEIWP